MYFGARIYWTRIKTRRGSSQPTQNQMPFRSRVCRKNHWAISCRLDPMILYPRAKLSNRTRSGHQSNRLGIPGIVYEEGLHGYMDSMKRFSPKALIATTWNPELAQRTGAAYRRPGPGQWRGHDLGRFWMSTGIRAGVGWRRFWRNPYLTASWSGLCPGHARRFAEYRSHVVAEPKHFAGHGSRRRTEHVARPCRRAGGPFHHAQIV